MHQYVIMLDPDRGDPHYDPSCCWIQLTISSHATGELGQIVALLDAGQYQLEGGFPCAGGTCRHPATSVRVHTADRPEGKYLFARFPGGWTWPKSS